MWEWKSKWEDGRILVGDKTTYIHTYIRTYVRTYMHSRPSLYLFPTCAKFCFCQNFRIETVAFGECLYWKAAVLTTGESFVLRLPTGARDFSFLQSIATGFGSHTASYSFSAGSYFPGIKLQGCEADNLRHKVTRLRIFGAVALPFCAFMACTGQHYLHVHLQMWGTRWRIWLRNCATNRLRVRFALGSLIFFIDLILPAAPWRCSQLNPCAGLTTLSPSCAEYSEL